ncbi:sensor histidine kinase [Catenuloplanes sp. NPDC051500]|uniref:sensor histidine kinase n=1 Tax=Catenuloplanes sp. NPDC051500 TaxID=3363959 RepID=UPI0037A643F5
MIGRLVLAAVLGLGLLLEIAVTVSAHPPVLRALFTVTAALGVCLAAVLRRRHPRIAAAVAVGLVLAAELVGADGAEGPAPVAFLAMLIVIGAAVRRLRFAEVVLVWAGGAAPVLLAESRYSSTVTLVMMIGWAAATGAGAWLRVADGRQRALRETVRRTERVALARDLHDVAAHHLTALIIQAQAGQVRPGDSRAVLSDIETAGVEALDSLRRLARLLRDENEAAPTPPGTVADLVTAFGRRGLLEADLASAWPDDADTEDGAGRVGATLELPDGPQPEDWPPEVATGIYRIAQEALTNVARHADGARQVTVTLAHDTRSIRLTVTDDGRAAPSPPGSASGHAAPPEQVAGSVGRGLDGMRERATALGGTLTAGPTDRGWIVRAVLPAPLSPIRSVPPSWKIWR